MKIKEVIPKAWDDPVEYDKEIESFIFDAIALKLQEEGIDLYDFGDPSGLYLLRSGEKTLPRMVERWFLLYGDVWDDPEDPSDIFQNKFARIITDVIMSKFALNWSRLYKALHLEYNPIENYSMTEEGTDEHNSARNTAGSSSTDNETTGSSYGFDSKTAVPTDVSRGVSGTSDKQDEREQGTTKHNFKRSGNIGVTTAQQMLESEFELRKKTFVEQVFSDIDSVVTLAIYD